jgi:hypothetical protein
MKWITATNLEQWAETLPARVNFPGLIADLIRASASEISNIRFPSGDKGQVRGFDGVLDASGVPPYVPDGKSIWEFGVTGSPTGKANSDFTKRTGEVLKAIRKQTTFVFVSPRTWDNPKEKIADWVKEKRDLCEWKSVEYLDGVAVEAWLAQQPAVASRYARYELKLMPALGARSTDEFWEEYANRFSPTLVEEVLLAGRESQAKGLLQRLSDGVGKLSFAADSPDEVIAFATAAIRRAEPAVRLFLEARTLIVDTEEAARQLACKSRLIFLPRAQARGQAGVLAKYGPTVVSAGADEKRSIHELLARPDSTTLGKAFMAMGFSEQQGYETARRCGRSLAVLARQMPSGTAERPEWMEQADSLLPALLAGAWKSTTPADQAILRSIAECQEYDAVEAPLRKLKKLKDPPVDHVGDVWAMRASVDAFVNLGHLIGAEHLRRFSAAAHEVFSCVAPTPRAEEVYQPPSEREAMHSSWLRDGLMNTLLHMAVLHEQAEFTVQGMSPQEYVNGIVRSLPGLSSDYRLLASLQDNLALLAEASPIPFLEALERLLEGDAAAIKPIFEEHKGLLTSHNFHLGVLWALETLAWEPSLLLRSTVCLARLAEIDPGGTLSNRPINSLRSIFLAWAPNTSADVKQRLGVLTHVVKAVPSIAWSLLSKLLPKHSDISSPTQRPKFRESARAGAEVLTYGVVWESQACIIQLALERAGASPERWGVLIGAMSQFQPEMLAMTLNGLDVLLACQSADEGFQIWDALRKETNRHRAFANTEWAFKTEALPLLDAVVNKYQPTDALLVSSWLFDDWMPDIPEKHSGVMDPMVAINNARSDAIRIIFARDGVRGLVELANRVNLPQHVAAASRSLELTQDQLLELLRLSLNAGEKAAAVSAVVVAEGVARFDDVWVQHLRSLFINEKFEPSRFARLLMALDETKKTWATVRSFGELVEDAFWEQKHSSEVIGGAEDLLFAIDTYVSHGRAMAAIEASHRRLIDVPSSLLMHLLAVAVLEINATKGGVQTMTVYYIELVFDELEKRPDIAVEELAKMEFSYLPCFSHRKRPLTFHRLMVQRADMFMDAVCAVFKPASQETKELSDEARRLAMAAYELLEGLRILPGQSNEGIDVSVLKTWCLEVRELAEKMDRMVITDQRIGHLLAHAPESQVDKAWPHEAVRAVVELLASSDVEKGLEIERYNMRGVYNKAIGEGGSQERILAKTARDWANTMPDFPRTAATLTRISDGWIREADEADTRAEVDALRN